MHSILTPSDATTALTEFAGRRKLTSWLALLALGYPTSRGLIIEPGESLSSQQILDFCGAIGSTSLLVRSDQPLELPGSPRGGFLLEMSDARVVTTQLQPFQGAGRTLFLLEPFDPLSDLYSFNSLAWPGDDLVLEFVGPGFDASDLKRDDITPHERVYATRSGQIVSRKVIARDAYDETWMFRARKVASWFGEEVEDRESALRAMRRLNAVFLVDSSRGYIPIPGDWLMPIVRACARLGQQLAELGLPGEPLAVSGSYVGDGRRPVFWDVVWPSLKYEGLRR